MIYPKKNSKIQIKWKVSPYDYSKEIENNIQIKTALKYDVPIKHVKVIPEFLMIDSQGKKLSLTKDIIANIQDSAFQQQLFAEYLEINKISDYDFSKIEEIDKEVNSYIDYNQYEKFKKFKLKWIKWDNFLSYGKDNFFDFSELNGLVLLHGVEPYQNQSGKTTFAIDLFHFLLFGKTSKTEVLAQVFNKHIAEATEVRVEGCITIDNVDYLIKRTLSRPVLNKRTSKSKVTQKVEYFKILADSSIEELYDEVESQSGESVMHTNKIIKESIGSESDFDLMICATASNLDALVDMKDTERGRLLSKWIGLLLLEDKETVAKKIYNENVKRQLLSNIYNRETLIEDIKQIENDNKSLSERIRLNDDTLKNIEKDIILLEDNKTSLMNSRENVDSSVLKLDITTLKQNINTIIEKGKNKKNEIEIIEAKLKEFNDEDFDQVILDKKIQEMQQAEISLAELRINFKNIQTQIKSLRESEFCPTCGRKYENVNNEPKIQELETTLKEMTIEGKKISKNIEQYKTEVNTLKIKQQRNIEKNNLFIKKAVLETQVSELKIQYQDKNHQYKEFLKNSEAIEKNNKLELSIRNVDANLKEKRNQQHYLSIEVNNDTNKILNNNKIIEEKKLIIEKIQQEMILEKHWKIYLDMVGKNGIIKMVLRKALPIINANLNSLLSNVCDFNLQVEINEKNEIGFFLIKNGIKSPLSSGSGFELTCSSLALRSVLAKISSLPKPNFLILDEVLGRVAQTNFDNMKLLYDKILEDYDFIIQVTHIEAVKDWHDYIISVSKESNISKIAVMKNKR